MKVVFLDVDGVLNTEDSLGESENDSDFIFDSHGVSPLERRCLTNLIKIILATDAKIVVTSTWRMFPDMMQFLTRTIDQFYMNAVSQLKSKQTKTKTNNSVIIGSTIDAGAPPFGGGRGQEVRKWLESHPECDRFVVIDDGHKASFEESLFGEQNLSHGMKGVFIETKLGGVEFIEQGLTSELVDIAVQFLINNE